MAAIFGAAVPDLSTIVSAALSTNNLCGEGTAPMKMTAVWTSALDFVLHQLEGIRIDNGWVRVLDVILRDLAIIFLDSFGEEIYGVGFLEQGVAFVFLILAEIL